MGKPDYSELSFEEQSIKRVNEGDEKQTTIAKNQVFTRSEVIAIVERIAFFISDNGIIEDEGENSVAEWFKRYYPEK